MGNNSNLSDVKPKQTLREKIEAMDKAQKIQLIAALIMTVLLIISMPTFAWFSYQNEMAVSTKIDSPATLEIKSGGHPGEEQAIINFELSDIDTEDSTYNHYTKNGVTYYYKDFVFCVKGKSISSYDLQLAHTTNIAFKYEIYSAIADDNGDILYMPKDNNAANSQRYRLARIKTDANGDAVLDNNDEAIYEDYNEPLDGAYANATIVGNRVVVNDSLKGRSYDVGTNGDNVQQYANPAYWIKRGIVVHSIQKQDGGFTHPYVLRISWIMSTSIDDEAREEDLNIVQNNKETDMIYITAKARS
ncbi:MAG: hypothetical protein IJJ76_02170 [Ruminococcus sp.]|uniref:hypothetical protein n=1 Tax=Ruminococcus sp. TaxID=41978 RepID=UPI0025DF6857|nr:hypothetical protein [Ruminococcus sp.]MBR0528555.1 hypothetical protein [Ruminococcus sp.]